MNLPNSQDIILSSRSNPRLRDNNFDLLRLLFAATVCLVHSYQLSGFQQLAWIAHTLSSAVAVKAFFVVSGFLIFMSYERSTSLASYAQKRIRRIYPAYFAVVMLCAILLAASSSTDIAGYFSLAWIKYVFANLLFLNFLQPTLPGVFETNNISAVNGALWTLKIEAMFYLSVPVFALLFRKFSRLPIIVIVYCASVTYVWLLNSLAGSTGAGVYAELARQLPGQLSYFMSGAALYYYFEFFERKAAYFMAASCLILIADSIFSLPLLEPFALATVVIFFGLFLYAGNFGKYGDFSYGIYILHFPIIQLLLHGGWLNDTPWVFLIALTTLTFASSIAMWHGIEKRFLFRSSHYLDTPHN